MLYSHNALGCVAFIRVVPEARWQVPLGSLRVSKWPPHNMCSSFPIIYCHVIKGWIVSSGIRLFSCCKKHHWLLGCLKGARITVRPPSWGAVYLITAALGGNTGIFKWNTGTNCTWTYKFSGWKSCESDLKARFIHLYVTWSVRMLFSFKLHCLKNDLFMQKMVENENLNS